MRILLTGNLFHDYELDMKDGLEQLGHEVGLFFNNIQGPYHPFDPKTFVPWVKYGFLPHKLKISHFTRQSIERYNEEVCREIDSGRYDLLLVVGAKTIAPDTVRRFPGPKVLWFMDALPRYPEVVPKLPLFDKIFLFESSDVPFIKEKVGMESRFLTLAFNPAKYFRVPQVQSYDLSFVGSFYPKRDEYLGAALGISDRMGIYGDFHRSKNAELRSKVKSINAPHSANNALYNASRINLNIHHPQSVEGMSIRTFEILGAGGFQLVERQVRAVELFEEGVEIEYYASKDEFLDKIRFYLKNDTARLRIAARGHELALRKHTWKERMRELLQLLA